MKRGLCRLQSKNFYNGKRISVKKKSISLSLFSTVLEQGLQDLSSQSAQTLLCSCLSRTYVPCHQSQLADDSYLCMPVPCGCWKPNDRSLRTQAIRIHPILPGRKGRADLTSSPPSSHLTVAVSSECPPSRDGN